VMLAMEQLRMLSVAVARRPADVVRMAPPDNQAIVTRARISSGPGRTIPV